jgi:site-specific DNA-cytosine methylase
LAIDLFCGLGGWTEGLLAEGYYVVGFDIERHQYGEHQVPGAARAAGRADAARHSSRTPR